MRRKWLNGRVGENPRPLARTASSEVERGYEEMLRTVFGGGVLIGGGDTGVGEGATWDAMGFCSGNIGGVGREN